MRPKDFLPPISVIVHVHDTGSMPDACIESILAQEYPNLNVLLLVDSSDDSCVKACLKYSHQFDFVQVYPSAPKGAVHAWNCGLEQANGYYILFMDSRDTLETGAIGYLTDAIYRHDLAIGHLNIVQDDQIRTLGFVSEPTSMGDEAFLQAVIQKAGSPYYSALWNKMYRSDIIWENGLAFDPSLAQNADSIFNLQYFQHVKSAAFTNNPVYSRTDENAFQRSFKLKYRQYQGLKNLFRQKGLYAKYRFQILSHLIK